VKFQAGLLLDLKIATRDVVSLSWGTCVKNIFYLEKKIFRYFNLT